MKYRLLLIVVFMAFASSALAQSHPCDTAFPSNPSVSNPYKVKICSDLKDPDGNVYTPAEVQLQISIDGTAQALRALPTPTGSASATGFNLYEVQQVSAKGNHTVVVQLVTTEGTAVTPPFAFVVRGKALKVPVIGVGQ